MKTMWIVTEENLEMYGICSIYKMIYVGNHAEHDKSVFWG